MILAQVLADVGLPVHEVTWLPHWVAQVWRVAFWISSVFLMGRMWIDSLARGGLRSTRLLRWAVAVFLARSVVTQIENFYGPITYEGLPVNTLVLGLAWWSVHVYHEPEECEERRRAGVEERF